MELKRQIENDQLHIKMAIPSDPKRFPSEVLVILLDAKLQVIRRFVNELLKYFLIQSVSFNDQENTERISMHQNLIQAT